MTITCFVTVMLLRAEFGRVPQLIEMTGRITSSTDRTYTVDFGSDARLLGLEGNFTHKVVSKKDCGQFD